MLSKKEISTFLKLSKKVKNPKQGLPQGVFDAISQLVPFPACEIVVFNSKGEMLLTWRQDQWWNGWHIPGGLMRFKETFQERLNNTAKKELGAGIKSFKFLFVENYYTELRGHSVSCVFLCKLTRPPKQGKFFKTMPKDLIKQHKIVWKKIHKHKIV